MVQLTQRVHRIKPSPTLAIAAKASELKARGKDIISLSLGEPDFDTPEHIRQAASHAMQAGETHYTAVDGIAELKNAIASKLERDNTLHYTSEQILVSCGAKHSIYNALQALIEAGDEVIIPTPYWSSYPDMVKLCHGEPILVKTDISQSFKLSATQLEANITPKTKLIIINSPSNPTGMVYTAEELRDIADVLLKHPHVLIMSDDIYEHIIWDTQPFQNIVSLCPELIDRTIVINGVSKAYAMTGWRIGYAAGPAKIIKAMKKIQSQVTSNPCSISQAAAVAALDPQQQACMQAMVDTFKQRHDFVVNALNQIDGFHCLPAQGAFYAFPDISQALKKKDIATDIEFAEQLLEAQGVAIVPGEAFGATNCLRLSYAATESVLEKALERIDQFMS